MKNKIPEPKLIGKTKFLSVLVNPGIKYKKSWNNITGILIKIPLKAAIFMEAKKYSPGANCKNFTPKAGTWRIFTISLTSEKHIIITNSKNNKLNKSRWLNSSICSYKAISSSIVVFILIKLFDFLKYLFSIYYSIHLLFVNVLRRVQYTSKWLIDNYTFRC